jgi:hypothetical protein
MISQNTFAIKRRKTWKHATNTWAVAIATARCMGGRILGIVGKLKGHYATILAFKL